jgi:REP element-mobilizing transposase RayT
LARLPRIEYEGALYHVTDRGVEKREIFLDTSDYRQFISYLKRATERFNLLVHGFCLIPNHYHLECETPNANLSKFMQWLNTSYAVYFNRRYERVGHVFQGRYYSTLVQKERHLMELTRYIHLNPVRAGLVRTPEKYEWGSYRRYMGKAPELNWVETDWMLSQFGSTKGSARQAYRDFVSEGLERHLQDPLQQSVDGVLGDEAFLDWVTESFFSDEPLDRKRASRRTPRPTISVQEVIQVVSSVCAVHCEDIRKKGSHGNTARDIALYLSQAYSGLHNVKLGKEFGGMSQSNVSNICRKVDSALGTDEVTTKTISAIRELLLKKRR